MNKQDIYKRVLIVGPDCRNHRGGIGAVIESYKKYFEPFNFISTYKTINKYFIPFYSIRQILWVGVYLLFHPVVKVVHIHGASRGSFFRKYFVFLIAKYIFSKKIIYHIHGGEFHVFTEEATWLTRKMIGHFTRKTDVLVCLSSKWEEFFSSRFYPKRIEVIRNFVQMPEQKRERTNENGKTIFLFLGKIEKNKGIYDLIEVVKDMSSNGSKEFELWAGGNGETTKLEKFIKENKLQEYIKFLGWISGDQKRDALRRADVYVLPSYNEGMPVSILEAMSYGIPVISTRTGGIPELVADKVSGLLIEPGDRDALGMALQKCIKDKTMLEEMGKNSVQIVENGFTAKSSIQKLTDIYMELINS